MTEVTPVSSKSLKSDDVFLLDIGDHIYVWIGLGASKNERAKCLSYATEYLVTSKRPSSLPITRVLEGGNLSHFSFAIDN